MWSVAKPGVQNLDKLFIGTCWITQRSFYNLLFLFSHLCAKTQGTGRSGGLTYRIINAELMRGGVLYTGCIYNWGKMRHLPKSLHQASLRGLRIA